MFLKRITVWLLCLCFLTASCAVAEVSEEEFDGWFEDMVWLVEQIGERKMNREGQQTARKWLTERFEAMGYSREDGTLWEHPVTISMWEHDLSPEDREDPEKVKANIKEYTSASLIAVKPALQENAPVVVVCAHYDSNGPGARDNASGMAAVLMFAEKFAQLEPFENTEIQFIAFTAEELNPAGSLFYVEELPEEERQRILAVWNMDIMVVDNWESELALSCDTLGGWTEQGYVNGTPETPVWNRAARAFFQSMIDLELLDPDLYEEGWCSVRHWGQSDHESFHMIQVDSCNVCFQGNTASEGCWPSLMHTDEDVIGDFELERSREALEIVDHLLEAFCEDHDYGAEMGPEKLAELGVPLE